MKKFTFADKMALSLTAMFLILTMFVISPFSNQLGSMAVMSIYSNICKKQGIPEQENITLSIPGDSFWNTNGWFPFVMTFVPGRDFGASVGKDCSLTILYNFPAFDPFKGCSRLYDPQSKYYSSFYGAYLVKTGDNTIYGFDIENNRTIVGINEEEVAAVARYDYQTLVLRDFGLSHKNAVFSFEITDNQSSVSYVGSDGWYKADAVITVNGCAHERKEFVQSYLQYGIPSYPADVPLETIKMYGRIYGNYIESKGVSIFFYVITADGNLLEECDRNLLSKSTLSY